MLIRVTIHLMVATLTNSMLRTEVQKNAMQMNQNSKWSLFLWLRSFYIITIFSPLPSYLKDMSIILQMIPHSFILTEWFGHSVLPNKVGWFLAFSSKWEKFPSTEDNFSRRLFSNYCHSLKNLLRAIKQTANGHKYPKFSLYERS